MNEELKPDRHVGSKRDGREGGWDGRTSHRDDVRIRLARENEGA
jgi:hypothetical protein